jgi:hypothetical protein
MDIPNSDVVLRIEINAFRGRLREGIVRRAQPPAKDLRRIAETRTNNLQRHEIFQRMHQVLSLELRSMIYAYMFPVPSIRVLDAYSPAIRGSSKAVLFILNDTHKMIV